jgi:hypothetical protein
MGVGPTGPNLVGHGFCRPVIWYWSVMSVDTRCRSQWVQHIIELKDQEGGGDIFTAHKKTEFGSVLKVVEEDFKLSMIYNVDH